MIYVLDASVLLKWFVEEPDSPHALTYRTRLVTGSCVIACPDLALYEVGNVLRHKRGIPELALVEALADLLRLELEILTPTEAILRVAARLSYAGRLTFYDAVYVALAQELHATLVSADLPLCLAARSFVHVESLPLARRL